MRGLLVSALEVLLLGHCVFAVNVHEKLCLSLLLKEDGPDPRLESSKPKEEERRDVNHHAAMTLCIVTQTPQTWASCLCSPPLFVFASPHPPA